MLTQLEFTEGSTVLDGEHVSCLSKLRSLGLHRCILHTDNLFSLQSLTALTHLDLRRGSAAYWQSQSVTSRIGEVKFGPALQVLKLEGCYHFDQTLQLNCETVRELHIDSSLLPKLTQTHSRQQLHLSTPLSLLEELGRMPTTERHPLHWLVGLKVNVRQHWDAEVEACLDRLPDMCPFMRDLQLVGTASLGCRMTHSLSQLTAASFPFLTDLSLIHVSCSSIDLQQLTPLTHVELAHVDTHNRLERVRLPPNVQTFAFRGSTLFEAASVDGNLHLIAGLSGIILEPVCCDHAAVPWQPVLPQLPQSVTHLRVEGPGSNFIVDWTALQAYQDLEHLTLDVDCYPLGGLQHLMSAGSLCIIDRDFENAFSRHPEYQVEEGALVGIDIRLPWRAISVVTPFSN